MVNSATVFICGEKRVLTEALATALRVRSVFANVIPSDSPDVLRSISSPDVLILASCGSWEQLRGWLTAAYAVFPESKAVVVAGRSDKNLMEYALANPTQCILTVDSFERLVRTLEILREERDAGKTEQTAPADDHTHLNVYSPDLTLREQDIFKSISAGLSNKEIASLFSISPSTVKNHVHSILTKLKVRRRRQVLGRAYIPRFQAGAAAISDPTLELRQKQVEAAQERRWHIPA